MNSYLQQQSHHYPNKRPHMGPDASPSTPLDRVVQQTPGLDSAQQHGLASEHGDPLYSNVDSVPSSMATMFHHGRGHHADDMTNGDADGGHAAGVLGGEGPTPMGGSMPGARLQGDGGRGGEDQDGDAQEGEAAEEEDVPLTGTVREGLTGIDIRVQSIEKQIDELTQAGLALLDSMKAQFAERMDALRQDVGAFRDASVQRLRQLSAETVHVHGRLVSAQELVSQLGLSTTGAPGGGGGGAGGAAAGHASMRLMGRD